MVQKETKYKSLLVIFCVLNVLLLSVGHYASNIALIWGSLLLFVFILSFSKKRYFLPLLLFYLPWSTVLKPEPDSFTLFTLVVPVVMLLIIIRNPRLKIDIHQISISVLFICYTLAVRMVAHTLEIQTSYLFFVFLLVFIPIYVRNFKEEMDFKDCVLFMTIGLITACLAANVLMNMPKMMRFINVDVLAAGNIVRLSGFYGDPNFYSAQIILAITSILITLGKTKSTKLIFIHLIAILILVFFGIQSVSKTFLFGIAGIFVLWMFTIIIGNHKSSFKAGIVITLSLLVAVVLLKDIFTKEIGYYLLRFSRSTDANSLMTGRLYIWNNYIRYIFDNPLRFLFGLGLYKQYLNLRASHNTLIQIIYQVGIFGAVLLFVWWKSVYGSLIKRIRLNLTDRLYYLTICIAYILPWISLDFLYFDEFFYYLLLAFLARNYLVDKRNEIVPLGDNL